MHWKTWICPGGRSVRCGAGIRCRHRTTSGFNLYRAGSRGTGSRELVQHYLERRAAERPMPPDWCYVFNFKSPEEPLSLRLPAGEGQRFRADSADADRRAGHQRAGGVRERGVPEPDAGAAGRVQPACSKGHIEAIGSEAAEHDIALITTPNPGSLWRRCATARSWNRKNTRSSTSRA
jgi:hypothetical protein